MKKNTRKLTFFCFIIITILILPNILFSEYQNKSLDKLTLEKFTKKECSNHSTNLSKSKELLLNKKGIFDSEINDFDNKTISDIESSDHIIVTTSYYDFNKDDNNANTSNKMSKEDIDNYINSKYGNKPLNSKTNKIHSILSKFNLTASTALAATNKDTAKTTGGKFKQTMLCTTQKGHRYFKVSYFGQWLSEPKYEQDDVLHFSFRNATIIKNPEIEKNKISASHYGRYDSKKAVTGKADVRVNNRRFSIDLTKSNMNATSENDLVFTIKLGERRFYLEDTYKQDCIIYQYNEHKIKVSFYANIDDINNYVTAKAEYHHQESSKNIKWTVSPSVGGITINVSPERRRKINSLVPLILQFKAK